jgi:cyclopropane-fatty-acyl-phospholipid synthase
MAARTWRIQQESAQKVLQFLQSFLSDFRPRDFGVELWDGTRWPAERNAFTRFTWKINNPDGLKKAIFSANRQVGLAEAYSYGDFDIEGDMEAVFGLAEYIMDHKWTKAEKLRLMRMALTLPSGNSAVPEHSPVRLQGNPHSRQRDRQAVSYHYDVSNDFYALWLDRNMQYSSAYFEQAKNGIADTEINEAQQKKLASICRKLQLKPGERLLDIGCGWGGLICFAAREFDVSAVGITLSRQQLKGAEDRIRNEGLADRCQVRLLDYRDLDEPEGFDKIVSIGMVEHVGERNLPSYFRQAYRLLRPNGLFLNSGIARAGNRPAENMPSFTDLYIFPDGELVPISNLLSHAEIAGFEVEHVENLREHYRLTLLHWLRRLEAQEQAAKKLVGEVKYRMWRLYLAGSAYYFQASKLDLYHSLFLKTVSGSTGASG